MKDKKSVSTKKSDLRVELKRLQKRVDVLKEIIGESIDHDSSQEVIGDKPVGEAASAEDKLFLAIVKQAPFSMWASRCKKGNYEIVLWNEGAERIYGYSKDKALGANYLDLFVNQLEKSDSAADCEKIIKGEEFRNFLATDLAEDGSRRIMLTNCFRIWDDKRNEYLQAEVGLDVSELQRSEEEYRSLREFALQQQEQTERIQLLERLRKISTIITSSIIYEEQGLQKVLEQIVTRVDELIGEKTYSILCLYGDARNTAEFSACIFNQPQPNSEFHGDEKLIALSKFVINSRKPCFIDAATKKPEGFPLRNIDTPLAILPLFSRELGVGMLYVELRKDYQFTADVKEVLGLFTDQAVVAVQNARLIQNLKELNKIVAEKQEILTRSQIAVDFAHRMNNMAAPFLMWVDLIEEELDSSQLNLETIRSYLGEVKTQSQDLLQEAKKIEYIPEDEEVNVGELLEAMVRNVVIQSKDVKVDLQIPNNLYSVKTIKSLLSNAIWNVISNSLDAMNNSGKLTLKGSNITRNKKKWIKLVVKDSGPGIPDENREHIFQINYSTKGVGHGYGLWRTKQIVENIGGEITLGTANSKVGTTFTFLLPAL